MPSVSDENQTLTKPVSAFRQSVGSITKKSKWVSPFRQQSTIDTTAPKAEKHEKSETTDTSAPAAKKQKVQEEKPVDRTINPVDLEKRLGELSTTADSSTNKKIKPEDRIVDLGGGLKMSQAAIDKIARERLGKDLEEIDQKASSQQKLRELKHQKKLELQALKDENKVNSRFAKFKKKLDLEKKTIQSEHDKKVKEIEASIASLDQQIKDFDKKTTKEIEQTVKEADTKTKTADEKLVQDKEKTSKESANLEKEHLQTIHDHQISQKRSEIASRVLHAKQSEYELELELLELKLAQSNREVSKQKEYNSSHTAIKEELEAQIATTKQAIAENTEKIEKSENIQLESARSLKSAQGELESSKEAVESLKAQLADLKAGKGDREARLQEAVSKRKLYDEEQERLRKEAEEKARIAEEERLRKEEEDKQRKAEEEERLRQEEEEKKRQEEEQKRLEEEERLRKEEELRKAEEEKKKKHELAVASFGEDLDSRKTGLDKEIEEKKASNANPDEIALLELERNHLNGWSYENQDAKARELKSSLADTKKDQQAKAKIAEKEAKKKAAIAEKEEKKKAAAAAKEEKKRAAAAEKEEKKKKKSSAPGVIGAAAIPAAVIAGTGAGTAAVAGAGASGASKGASGVANAVPNIGSGKSVQPQASTDASSAPIAREPAAETTTPTAKSTAASAPLATEPVAKTITPTAKSETATSVPKERPASPKDSERKSRRSSFFGLFKKKSKDSESVSPEREASKKKSHSALGAAVPTTVGAGIVGAGAGAGVGAGIASDSATKLASTAPGGPVATSANAPAKDVEPKDTLATDTSKATEPKGVIGSTDAIKDEVEPATEGSQVEPIAVGSSAAEPVNAEKTTELADEESPVPSTVGVAGGDFPKASSDVKSTQGAEVSDGHNFGGTDIENVTGSEFQTSYIQGGDHPILAVKAADPNISLEEITLEQAKNEDNVLAVVAGHDSTLQEVKPSQFYSAQATQAPPHSKASDVVFDQSRGPDTTAPSTADETIPEVQSKDAQAVPVETAAGIAGATGAAGAGYALGSEVGQGNVPQEQVPQQYQAASRQAQSIPQVASAQPAGDYTESSSSIPASVAAGIAAATGAAGAGYALGSSKAEDKEPEQDFDAPLASEVEQENRSTIEPAPTKKDTLGESANQTAPLAATVVVPETVDNKGAETTEKTPLNQGSYVEPAPVSIPKEQKFEAVGGDFKKPTKDSSAPVAAGVIGGATAGTAVSGLVGEQSKSKDEAPVTKGDYVEPAPIAIPKEQKFEVVGGDHVAPKSVEQPPISKNTVGAATAGALGGAAISHGTNDKEIPKSAEPLVDSSSAPKVIKASEPQTLPPVSHEEPVVSEASKSQNFHTLDPGAPSETQDLSTTDDYTTSREATPEPGVILAGGSSSPSGKGKNAKKNKKKREAAKKKKKSAGVAGHELESSPEPEFAPSRSIDATTTKAGEQSDSGLGVVSGAVGGTLASAAAAVGLTSATGEDEKKKEDTGKVPGTFEEKKSAQIPAEPKATGSYEEPKPVEIPSDQKFSVAPGVSKTSNTEDPTSATTTKTESSEGPGILETAAIAATGVALTGAAVFESTKDQVVNAISGEADEDKTTNVTLKDSDAAENLAQHKDGLAEDVDVGYYSLDPKRASNRFSQNGDAPKGDLATTGDDKEIGSKESTSEATGSQKEAGGLAALAAGKDSTKESKPEVDTKPAPATATSTTNKSTVPKKPVVAKEQPKEQPKSEKKFFKKFWKSDKKEEPKPVATTPVKKSGANPKATGATAGAGTGAFAAGSAIASKPKATSTKDTKASTSATTTGSTSKDTKSASKPTKEVKDTELKEADASEISPSLAGTGTVTTGVIGGTAGGIASPSDSKNKSDQKVGGAVGSGTTTTDVTATKDTTSTPVAAGESKDLTAGDNDSLYSFREVFVYEEVTDDEDEGIISKAVKTAVNLSSTII